jgi:hypothetical protein
MLSPENTPQSEGMPSQFIPSTLRGPRTAPQSEAMLRSLFLLLCAR